MPADAASRLRTEIDFEGFMLRHALGIRFHREALHSLKVRSNRLLIRLGPPHFRVEALIDLAQGGIVRANRGHRAFGLLRLSKAGWLAEFFVFVAVHDSDRPRSRSI